MNPPLLLVFIGTRPEAIKMSPVIRALKRKDCFRVQICLTGQHREILDPTLSELEITPDWDLSLMDPHQTLQGFSSKCLQEIPALLEKARPQCILVQGDTSTSLFGALAAFYSKTPVAHIEAGLRTQKKYSPFPEEMNRKLLGCLSDFHFCPTKKAVENLLQEGIAPTRVFQTGNTSIDALKMEWERNVEYEKLQKYFGSSKIFLVTAHRRENFGEGLQGICQALVGLSEEFPNYQFLYPVHPNPEVRKSVFQALHHQERIHLLDPLNFSELVYILRNCSGVLTDSGGIQEEAPTLGLSTLILRKDTERPEAIETGFGYLVGTDPKEIMDCFKRLVSEGAFEEKAHWIPSSFGDGTAGEKIADILEKYLIY